MSEQDLMRRILRVEDHIDRLRSWDSSAAIDPIPVDFPTTLTELTDFPSTYAGSAGMAVIVNPSETGVLFAIIPAGGGGPVIASEVTIVDAGGYTAATNVEDALQEIYEILPEFGGPILASEVTILDAGGFTAMTNVEDALQEIYDFEIGAGDGLGGGGKVRTNPTIVLNLAAVSGLRILNDALQVGAGDGIDVLTNLVAVDATDLLGAGITEDASNNFAVDVSHNFTWIGNHTWNTATARFNGTLWVDTDLVFLGAQSITSSSVGQTLTMAPSGDLLLDPGDSKLVRAMANTALRSDHYWHEATGWQGTYQGEWDVRYLFADEMHVKAFIADLEMALAGGQIVTKSVAEVYEAFVIPNYLAAVPVLVKAYPGFPAFRVFQDGDVLAIRVFTRGTGLEVAFAFGTVVYVSTNYDLLNPVQNVQYYQTYTFTRYGSNLINGKPAGGYAASGTTVGAGAIVLDMGSESEGGGYYEVSAAEYTEPGASETGIPLGSFSPWAQVVTWDTHPWYDRTVRTRHGNLHAMWPAEIEEEYGFYAGDGSAVGSNDKFLRISNLVIEAHNLPIKLYDTGNLTVYLNPSLVDSGGYAGPSFALGATLPASYGDSAAGVWMGRDGDGVYKFRVGDPATQGVFWNGSTLTVSGIVNITNPGDINTSDLNNDLGWTDNTVADSALSSAAAALAAAAAAQSTADGKIESFYQTTAPVSASEGDLWFDTDDGNKIYVYESGVWVARQDSEIGQALLAASNAQATADGKIVTFYQASQPTAEGIGDLWIDTDNNNILYRWNGSVWQLARDVGIQEALSAAATAQITADGKIESFYQTTAPVTASEGDIWFDIDDGNKIYIYESGIWVERQDNLIAQAIQNAATAQETADGKIVSFFQPSPPTAEGVGDLWIDTDASNILYRWSGTAWVLVRDTGIQEALTAASTAQETADGKITSFYQIAEPTVGMAEGDIWFDTNDGYRVYVFSGGVWVDSQDSQIAAAIQAAVDAQDTADGKITTFFAASTSPPTAEGVGDLWWVTDLKIMRRWNSVAWVDLPPDWGTMTGIPARFGNAPIGDGLYLTASQMGFYKNSQWQTYLDNTGQFWVRGANTPNSENGFHGMLWDPISEVLLIYGDLYLNNSPNAQGGTSIGPELHIGDYGLINMQANGQFLMGLDSSFAAGSGSTFSIGVQGSGAYLSYAAGVLLIEGQIDVTDGQDLLPEKYQPLIAQFRKVTLTDLSSHFTIDSVDDFGFINMANGNRYLLVGEDSLSSRPIQKGYQDIISFIYKDGTGIVNPYGPPATDYWGVENAAGGGVVVNVLFERLDRYYDSLYYSFEDRRNHIVVGYMRVNSDYASVEGWFGRALSSTSVIGPGYIQTSSLSAFSANLGSVTGGSAVFTNTYASDTHKVWINDFTASGVVIAAGGTDRDNAPFRLYADGHIYIKGAGTQFVDIMPNGNVTISGVLQAAVGVFTGTVNATAGELGSNPTANSVVIDALGLNVGPTGQIRWNSNRGRLSQDGLYVEDIFGVNTTAILRVGYSNPTAKGFLDIDMHEASGAEWNFAIHIEDGGNIDFGGSSLYLGMTEKGSSDTNADAFTDRIYTAYTSEPGGAVLNWTDGFYAEMHGTGRHATDGVGTPYETNSSGYEGSRGIGLKVKSYGKVPSIIVNKQTTYANGSNVWITGSGQAEQHVKVIAGNYRQEGFVFVPGNWDNIGDIAEHPVALNANTARIINIGPILMSEPLVLPPNSPGSGMYLFVKNNSLYFRNPSGEYAVVTATWGVPAP